MIDTESDVFIVCPYCGYLHEFEGSLSGVFYSEGVHDWECDSIHCHKSFKVHTNTTYFYRTEELEE